MKQARFEQQYRPLWDSLEQQLEQLEALRVSRKKRLPLDRFVADYRQLCHQLALARERTYSLELQQYLNNLVLRAHRQLYRYNPPLADRIGEFFASGFPAAVRRQWKWHLVSALSFVLSIALAWIPDLHRGGRSHALGSGADVPAGGFRQRRHPCRPRGRG